ncbi:hypothetical protein L7F22_006806 [Adiantum nelumboides]|nr:hypothetical protein [Adiantum nelumboides]
MCDKLYQKTRGLVHQLLANGKSDIFENDTYVSKEQILEPLELCYRSLCETGDKPIADGSLSDVLHQFSCFGLSLVKLEIWQESKRHFDVMNAITQHLEPLFGQDLPVNDEVAKVLSTFTVVAELPHDCFGAYIISMVRAPSNVPIFYGAYNICMYFIPAVQRQYNEKYGYSELIPVGSSDVAYSIHGVFFTSIVVYQALIYEKGPQRVSIVTIGIACGAWFAAALCMVIVWPKGQWIWLVLSFNIIQSAITFIKYIPQAWMNYQRKSTSGYSIENILLDLFGSFTNLVQMGVQSLDQGSLVNFVGNVGKLLFCAVVLVYDSIFVVQHFCLYKLPDQPSFRISLLSEKQSKAATAGESDVSSQYNDDKKQLSHACSNKTMHSTRKSGLVTPRMRPAPRMELVFEAKSAVGNEVCGVVEDILMAKSSAVKSPRQQLTSRRLLHSLLSAKASPSVDTRDEASNEAVADAVKATPPPAGKKPTPKLDVEVVHDDVHTDVDLGKLEKGTLPTPTTVESGTDAIVDAMVIDAYTDAIADATIVDAYTNDIVDASIDSIAADGNVNDG